MLLHWTILQSQSPNASMMVAAILYLCSRFQVQCRTVYISLASMYGHYLNQHDLIIVYINHNLVAGLCILFHVRWFCSCYRFRTSPDYGKNHRLRLMTCDWTGAMIDKIWANECQLAFVGHAHVCGGSRFLFRWSHKYSCWICGSIPFLINLMREKECQDDRRKLLFVSSISQISWMVMP